MNGFKITSKVDGIKIVFNGIDFELFLLETSYKIVVRPGVGFLCQQSWIRPKGENGLFIIKINFVTK